MVSVAHDRKVPNTSELDVGNEYNGEFYPLCILSIRIKIIKSHKKVGPRQSHFIKSLYLSYFFVSWHTKWQSGKLDEGIISQNA